MQRCVSHIPLVVRPLLLLLVLASAAFGQITAVTDDVSTPIPGAGHDYIKMMAETVNPANGSLSIRIQVPVPKGRGLTVPFSFDYDSNGPYHLVDTGAGSSAWTSDASFLSQGGWSYSVPMSGANYTSNSGFGGDPPQQYACPYYTNYMFQDPSGGRHALGITVAESGTAECQAAQLNEVESPSSQNSGSDDFFVASTPGIPFGYPLNQIAPPLTVSDLDGTVYTFSDPAWNLATGGTGNTFNSLPTTIMDRNGNKVTVLDESLTGGKLGAFTFTDDMGRVTLSSDGFGSTGTTNHLTVSGLANPYQVIWGSVSASYNVSSTQINVLQNIACFPPSTASGTQPVIASIVLPDGVNQYQFCYPGSSCPNNPPYNPYGLVSEIIYPNGGWVKYTWQLSSNYMELYSWSGEHYPQIVPGACTYEYTTPVVTERQVSFDGVNPALDQHFEYTASWNGGGNWISKQTKVTTTDDLRPGYPQTVTTYQYVPSPAYWDGGYNAPFVGFVASLPVEQQITYQDSSLNTLKTVFKGWQDVSSLICEVDTLGSQQTSGSGQFSSYFNPSGSGLPMAVLTDKKEYAYGAVSPSACTNNKNGNSSTPSGFTRDTAFAYTATFNLTTTSGGTILDRPSSVTISGPSSTAAETLYGNYDAVGNAWLKTEKCLYNCRGDAATSYVYDSHGQVTSIVDPNGNPTGYTYQCSDFYLLNINYPLSESETFTFDCPSGRLLSSKDVNSQTTSYSYTGDLLGRLTSISYPDGGSTTYNYGSNACAEPSTTAKLVSGTSTYNETTTLDGLCQVTETAVTDPEGGSVKTDTVYDGYDRVWTVSNPYRSKSDPTYGLNPTTYTYDVLGRVSDEGGTKSILYPDGSSTSTTYSALANTDCSLVVDPMGNSRNLCSDALGRLAAVTEAPGSLNYGTSYTYDALDDLLSVNQGGQTRAFSYNSFKQLTQAVNPESGTINYTYDGDGNVFSKQDARSTTYYQYDPLNRLEYKLYGDGSAAVYAYDGLIWGGTTLSTGNVKGHLTASWSVQPDGTVAAANEFTVFDPMGRMQQGYECTPGTCGITSYPIVAGYDFLGNETSFWESNVDRYTPFDVAGRFSGMSASLNVTKPSPPLTGTATGPGTPLIGISAHSPCGGLQNASLGNGLGETRGYTNRCWLGSVAVGSVYSLGLAYNPNGNVAPTNGNVYAAGDSENGNWIYTYDAVNRLPTAAVTGQSFTYSYTAADGSNGQFGNMSCTNTGNLPCSPLGLAISAANNRITSTGYTYDGAGNLLTDNTHGYVYDDENRIACVLGTDGTCTSASAVLYLYDADGKRVGKQQGNTLEDYVYDPLGQISSVHDGSANLLRTEFYTPQGRHTASLDGGTLTSANLCWNHADWLGTERVRTNSSGTAVEWCTDTPYGMNLTCTPPDLSPMHFTGKQRDYESGNDYFGSRYYGSSAGRWMVPDRINLTSARLINPSNTLNKYAYAANNPLKYIDRDGEDITIFYRPPSGDYGHIFIGALNQDTGSVGFLDYYPAGSLNGRGQGLGAFNQGNMSERAAQNADGKFATLTIQTSPEEAQKVIDLIETLKKLPTPDYSAVTNNCTTLCEDVLQDLGLDFGDILPTSYWIDVYNHYSAAALAHPIGTRIVGPQLTPGNEYGNPRNYGIGIPFSQWLFQLYMNQLDKRQPTGCVEVNDNLGNHSKSCGE